MFELALPKKVIALYCPPPLGKTWWRRRACCRVTYRTMNGKVKKYIAIPWYYND